jgi:hypothetical protein
MAKSAVYHGSLLDITAPEHPVEVEIRADGSVMWVHVDGITVLRICQMKEGLKVDDHRMRRRKDK